MKLTFYTTSELAELLGVHPRRITNMVAAGVLTCLRDEHRRMLFNINHVMAALRPDRPIGNRPRAWKPPADAQPLDLDAIAEVETGDEGDAQEPESESPSDTSRAGASTAARAAAR